MVHNGGLIPELLEHLTHHPVTREYPFEKVETPEGFRGTPQLRSNTCVGCMACVRDCTSEAIEIVLKPANPADPPPVEGAKPVKKFQMILYLDRCVHCARCAEVCPKDAIYLDREFEMASFSRDALRLVSE
jgi:formate hydrogenlyase subunit 6/NADH:ubiquinone oxidoreductase subunit I